MLKAKSATAAIETKTEIVFKTLILFCKIIKLFYNTTNLIFNKLAIITKFLTILFIYLLKLENLSTQIDNSFFI